MKSAVNTVVILRLDPREQAVVLYSEDKEHPGRGEAELGIEIIWEILHEPVIHDERRHSVFLGIADRLGRPERKKMTVRLLFRHGIIRPMESGTHEQRQCE